MTPADQSFDPVEPGAALLAVAAHPHTVVVDLDETLYLRNSTEDFLDCAWPALPALCVLRALDVIKPWRWSGGDSTRDIWRVRILRRLMPWIDRKWRQRVWPLAARHGNRALLEALRQRSAPTVVATLGFLPIVTPLLAAFGLEQTTLVAMSGTDFDQRRRGKLALLQAACGPELVGRALVLTDSLDDRELLAACAVPLRVIWPEARYRRALSAVYMPGLYLSLVKRPGERYILRGIVQEDFALWLFGTITLASAPLPFFAGLLCLLLSFWTIYETGYVDNDRVGARYERAPKLSRAFHERAAATPAVQPWLWAALSGAAGLWLVRWPLPFSGQDAVRWSAVLLATWGWFLIYNRMDKDTRIWMFPGLQIARSMAVLAVVPATAIGVAALAAHALARWVPYFFYRFQPGTWPDTQPQAMRLMFLLVLGGTVAISHGLAAVLDWSAAAVFGWCTFRAWRELRQIAAVAHRIDRQA